jgi:hypothetical protein
MLATILTMMKQTTGNDDGDNKRRFSRRKGDSCVAVIDGQTYPVEDWCQGGVLVRGDDRLMALLQSSNITMKFRLSEKILTVAHKGRVVRKMKDKFALQFEPLTRDMAAMFQQVIDERAKPSYT